MVDWWANYWLCTVRSDDCRVEVSNEDSVRSLNGKLVTIYISFLKGSKSRLEGKCCSGAIVGASPRNGESSFQSGDPPVELQTFRARDFATLLSM